MGFIWNNRSALCIATYKKTKNHNGRNTNDYNNTTAFIPRQTEEKAIACSDKSTSHSTLFLPLLLATRITCTTIEHSCLLPV